MTEQSGLESYSIGVVTYHARYDKYFVPLIEKIAAVFPDKEIICIMNGHPDRTLQINYLKKVTTFLSRFSNVRYLTYDLNQSLSKCWNQLVIMSKTQKVLIMNDDTQVTDLFRQEFEKKAVPLPFTILNTSWSHFLMSKDIIKKVGWFDERYLGVGHEDADYGLRMTMANIPMTNTMCLGLNNYVVDEENPGWKSISDKVTSGKYAQVNFDLYKEKWATMDLTPGSKPSDFKYIMDWGGNPYPFSPKTDTSTPPMFYEFSCLDENNSLDTGTYYANSKNGVRVFAEKVYYLFLSLLRKAYRYFVKKLR